jgi:nicotinamide-nucleotide amidase
MTPPPGMIDRCWIVTVGDELINGVRVDTNTAWLAGRLETLGIEVTRAVSVGDREEAIGEVIAQARAAAPLVIVAGGLGPTTDDRTKGALAALFGVALERVGEIEAAVRAFFAARGRSVTPVNLDQALVPAGFGWHINPRGTAPGLLHEEGGRLLFVLPGVPGELKALYREWLEPLLREHSSGRLVRRRWLHTTGIGESDLHDRVGGLEDLAPAVTLAWLPSPFGVSLYLTGRGERAEEVERALDEAEARIRAEAAPWLVGGGEQLDLAGRIARLLVEGGQRLAVAESCSGGLIADLLTDVPGASAWLERTWVVYSNRAKVEELGVDAELIERHGAVSAPVARAMAEGARARAGADWSLAVTGIAGPTGGSPEKPVGLIFTACSGPAGTVVREYRQANPGRRYNKQRAAANALDLLRRLLEGEDPNLGGWESPR